LPIANAILTTENLEQAIARKQKKGAMPPASPLKWPTC